MLLVAIAATLLTGSSRPGSLTTHLHQQKVRNHGLWEFTYSYPAFSPVSRVGALASQGCKSFALKTLTDWKQDTKDIQKGDEGWLAELKPTIVTAHPNLVSVNYTFYADSHGAHPNTTFYQFNYGIVKGHAKQLTLEDLAKPGAKLLPTISDYVIKILRKRQASWVVDGQVKALDKKSGDEFVIKHDRLVYIFSPYEMGSYAEGEYDVDVPFSVILDKLDVHGPLAGA